MPILQFTYYNMERLIRFSTLRVRQTDTSFVRYLYHQVDWKERLIGILGARGTGKTTMLLQRIRRRHPDPDTALYLSLDDPWFQEHELIDLAENFANRGGRYLYLDEVHKYKGWAASVKTLYDTFPDLHILFTGSSILEIQKGDADLSRRAIHYHLEGLSFREYLNVTENLDLPAASLQEILKDHEKISQEIVRHTKVLKAFQNYIKKGYYPFFLEGSENYYLKLVSTLMQVLETDLIQIEHLKVESLQKLKRFLTVVAELVPFQPNISELSKKIRISRPMIYQFLDYLQRSSVIQMIYRESKGMKKLEKPDKIYLQNTNLSYSLSDGEPNRGTLRETFFVNQVHPRYRISYEKPFDFFIDSTHAVEVGGKNKNASQLINRKDGFLAIDDIETGYQNRIPLWLFGFLY